MNKYKVGDILIREDGDESKILSILKDDNVLLHSYCHDHNRASTWRTFEELEEFGWKLKEEKRSIRDVKIGDRVMEKFGYMSSECDVIDVGKKGFVTDDGDDEEYYTFEEAEKKGHEIVE